MQFLILTNPFAQNNGMVEEAIAAKPSMTQIHKQVSRQHDLALLQVGTIERLPGPVATMTLAPRVFTTRTKNGPRHAL